MTDQELAKIFCQLDEGCHSFKVEGASACIECRIDGEYKDSNWSGYIKDAHFVLEYFVPKAKLCEAMKELRKLTARIQTLVGE